MIIYKYITDGQTKYLVLWKTSFHQHRCSTDRVHLCAVGAMIFSLHRLSCELVGVGKRHRMHVSAAVSAATSIPCAVPVKLTDHIAVSPAVF